MTEAHIPETDELSSQAAVLAHNIRNPLQIISLQMNLLESSARQGTLQVEKILALVASVERAVGRISILLDGFLEDEMNAASEDKRDC